MPWRKPFINPNPSSYHDQDPLKLRSRLAQRAYEVWISEIMLQQTRVSVVIDYWTKWMARWPTISDLAAAQLDEVLEVWAGLGYYSRARRVHEAARMVCGHGSGSETGMNGVLPSSVEELCKVPGVGRYTAGAIAAIVFGLPEPMVDGNVLRVLSRQMAVLGDVKGDRKVVEVLWDAAGELVKAVARDEDPEGGPSDRPGRWGQAMMELGSTVCTPKPNCGKCPITETCRAYGEGLALAKGERECGEVMDIEELCDLCSSFEGEDELDGGKKTVIRSKKSSKRATRSRFFASTGPSEHPSEEMLETAVNHASKFPLKKPKKTIPEQETLVCAIRGPDGRFLIHKRPDKGLLAGLWEMPSCVLPDSNVSAAKRKIMAMSYASSLVTTKEAKGTNPRPAPALRHLGELGSIPWQFSHLRLTMHVHLFELDNPAERLKPVLELDAHQRWASQEELVTMGTGMKKCWSLVKQSIDQRPNIAGT
jgi:A/G-specific adenine glycosylase